MERDAGGGRETGNLFGVALVLVSLASHLIQMRLCCKNFVTLNRSLNEYKNEWTCN